MKLIIDIDNKYKEMVDKNELISPYELADIFDAIRNGVTISEKHGRLIDADAYIDKHEECGWLDDITVNEFNTITPTIIEADMKGGKE